MVKRRASRGGQKEETPVGDALHISASAEGSLDDFAAGSIVRLDPGESLTPDLSYIPEALRPLVEPIDSLVLDDQNVKDHGDADLPTHAASLRAFGIQRAVVVHRPTRKILAGNGTVLASKMNGWDCVPVIWFDGDETKARAFALADNAVGTLAGWNEANLAAAAADVEALFSDESLRVLTVDLNAKMQAIEAEIAAADAAEKSEEQDREQKDAKGAKDTKPEDVVIALKVVVHCRDEEQRAQIVAEMENRGFKVSLSTTREQ
jgi:ParB-like chromosome segregation protein Spo0J